MARKSVLLVEGKDDSYVVKALLGRRSLPWITEIKDHDGYVQLLEAIPIRTRESDIHALGILLDADLGVESRWHAVRTKLLAVGYSNAPLTLPKGGLILEGDPDLLRPRLGVWVMPDNTVPGKIEDFVTCLVPAGDSLISRARQVVDSIPETERKFHPRDISKAVIHTWLAWQKEPGTPLGQAITARFLDDQCGEVNSFITWIKSLYFTDITS